MHHEIPPRKDLIGNGFVLQLDNDPKHTASTVNKKHTHIHNGKLSATDWPFQSPHFNIMEAVWGHHDKGYNKKAANIQRRTKEIFLKNT